MDEQKSTLRGFTKQNAVIFYSWQSWTTTRYNRNFIEDALKKALKKIRDEKADNVIHEIDMATRNRTGSPDIAKAIFEKIKMCDIFIADITNIGMQQQNLKQPFEWLSRFSNPQGKINKYITNPNVSVELGFAASHLGWERIILVANEALGTIENLPFDLQNHFTVKYHLSNASSDEERTSQKKSLVNSLASRIKYIHKSPPPEIRYLNELFINELEPYRAKLLFLTWIWSVTDGANEELEFLDEQLRRFNFSVDELVKTSIPRLMLQYRYALTESMKYKLNDIIESTNLIKRPILEYLISKSFYDKEMFSMRRQEVFSWIDEKFNNDWLPKVRSFYWRYSEIDRLYRYLGIKILTPEERERHKQDFFDVSRERFVSREESDRFLEEKANNPSDKKMSEHTMREIISKYVILAFEEEYFDIMARILEKYVSLDSYY